MQQRPGRRPACPSCGYGLYLGPIVGVAVVLRDAAGQVLLGKRAHGAYASLWCIPCGYVDWGEDVRDAAIREMAEETGIRVTLGEVVAVHSNFHNEKQPTVGIWFAGTVSEDSNGETDGELSAIEYFPPDSPPPLAFATDAIVLANLARA